MEIAVTLTINPIDFEGYTTTREMLSNACMNFLASQFEVEHEDITITEVEDATAEHGISVVIDGMGTEREASELRYKFVAWLDMTNQQTTVNVEFVMSFAGS